MGRPIKDPAAGRRHPRTVTLTDAEYDYLRKLGSRLDPPQGPTGAIVELIRRNRKREK